MKRIIYFLALTTIILSCGKVPEQPEQTITSLSVDAAAFEVTATTALLKGAYDIVPISIEPDAVGFCYGTDAQLRTYKEVSPSKIEDEFFVEVNELLPETTYYFRAFVKVKDVIKKSSTVSFVTKNHEPVVISTAKVIDFEVEAAVCGGNVTSEGDASVTECGVCYSTNPMPTVSDSKVKASSSGLGSFTCNLTGLSENTKYYVRAYAVNKFGTYYGSVESFTTFLRPDYIEDGRNLGKGIAVRSDWNADGTKTILYWAPVNCGYEEKGEVNSNSDHRLGKLYQWGAGDSSLPYYDYSTTKVDAREMYYDTETPDPDNWYDWNCIKGTTSDEWNNNQGPCPEGWRLPTSQEFKVLCAGKNGSYGWVDKGTYAGQSNTYAGAEFFGANIDKTAGKGVFFPAAGSRNSDNGECSERSRGTYGRYWSSTLVSDSLDSAYYLQFHSSSLAPQSNIYRANCFSVRCVKE